MAGGSFGIAHGLQWEGDGMNHKHQMKWTHLAVGLLCLLCISMLFLSGCSKESRVKEKQEARQKNMETQLPIHTLVEDASLSSMPEFWQWAQDPDKLVGTDEDCNGRILAFMLMQNLIQSDGSSDYGVFIADDVEKISKYQRYEMLQGDLGTFISLFDDISVADCKKKQDYQQAYLKAWQDRGVQFQDGIAHLLCVVMESSKTKRQYIAHAAVMIEDGDGFLLIEKLGIGKQFAINFYVSREELGNALLGRKEFVTLMKSRSAFLLEDDHFFETE